MRSRTEPMNRLPLYREEAIMSDPADHDRPKTRADCEWGIRPCPYVGCRHNLYLDVSTKTGNIKFNFPHLKPEEMIVSCALDVTRHGPQTIESVGEKMNVTRERARQMEAKVVFRLQHDLTLILREFK